MNYNIQNIDLIKKKRIKSAIVNANNEVTLLSAKISSELNLIEPILIGSEQKIRKICTKNNILLIFCIVLKNNNNLLKI